MGKSAGPQLRRRSGIAMTIESGADIRAGVRALRRRCPVMRRVHDAVGDPLLRRRPEGFVGLAQVVVGQQVSAASAAAIWRRTEEAVRPFDAETLLAKDDATLKAAGLSRGKIRTLRAAADAIVAGRLSLGVPLDVDELRQTMLAIPGIGPWTADIYVMFCLGQADGFAPGDLALQLAAQRAFGLAARPLPRELEEIAERWRPWRGVAAHLLWAFHVHRDERA